MDTFSCESLLDQCEAVVNNLHRFEAAWEGDVPKIKELTLANWGPDQKQDPLSVATQDSKGFTPLAIAVYRRHFDIAKILLDIADYQYKAPKKDSELRRYRIADEDSDADLEDDDEIAISSQVIDQTYTVDNIASLQRSVGSKSSGEFEFPRKRRITNICQLRMC